MDTSSSRDRGDKLSKRRCHCGIAGPAEEKSIDQTGRAAILQANVEDSPLYQQSVLADQCTVSSRKEAFPGNHDGA